MNEISIKKTVFSSLFWVFINRISNHIVQFIIQIILARLLLPSEYGLITLVLVFIQLANIFVDSGFNNALIQKQNSDDLDFSSVFIFSICVAFLFYIVIFFMSPLLAKSFQTPQLTKIIRVLSITLFIGVFNTIQGALIAKNFWFKKIFLSSLIATILSGVLAILAAYNGFGVWSLVVQMLSFQFFSAFIITIQIRWIPSFSFSFVRIKGLFKYSYRLLLSSFIDTLHNNFTTLIIGKLYTPDLLAFYDKGRQFPLLVISEINGSIQTVLFPVFSSYQDSSIKVKSMLKRSIRSSTFLVFPMMIGIAVLAEPIILFLLTEKWINSVPFVQVFAFTFSLWPIHTSNLQAIKAMGRSDIFLKLELVKKSISISILGVSIFFGIYGIVIGNIISAVLSVFINVIPNRNLLNYSFKELFLDIFPNFFVAAIMGLIVYSLNFQNISLFLLIVFKVGIGAIAYIILSYLFKNESFNYFLNVVRYLIKDNTKNI